MFDEQPDGDPHGECALEISRLTTENEKLRAVLTSSRHREDGLARACDVLKAIQLGLRVGAVKSKDIEFLYSDGPKRVPMAQLVDESIAAIRSAMAGVRSDSIPRSCRTHY